MEIFKKSDIIANLIHFIQKYNKSLTDFCIIILEILNFVCKNKQICTYLCSLGFLKDLLYIIYDNKDEFKKYIVRISFEILWNSIHLLSKKAVNTI